MWLEPCELMDDDKESSKFTIESFLEQHTSNLEVPSLTKKTGLNSLHFDFGFLLIIKFGNFLTTLINWEKSRKKSNFLLKSFY